MLATLGAKLSDLGLAHVVSPGMTVTSIGRIDPIEFLDPGILAHRERPSRASDIWSLGVTLHHALTGKGIYGDLPEDDPLFAIRAVLGQRPAIDPQLAAAEREIVSQCLAHDPRDRPATALEVADALDRIDTG
jgi:serine/threonine protein kinase